MSTQLQDSYSTNGKNNFYVIQDFDAMRNMKSYYARYNVRFTL